MEKQFALVTELKKKNAQLMQLHDSCGRLMALNDEFVACAREAVEILEHNKIMLTPALAKFIADVRKFDKMVGLDAEVAIAPPLNQDSTDDRKKQIQEMVG